MKSKNATTFWILGLFLVSLGFLVWLYFRHDGSSPVMQDALPLATTSGEPPTPVNDDEIPVDIEDEDGPGKAVVQNLDLNQLPKLPWLDQGCEGECCGNLASPVTRGVVKLFTQPDEKSAVLETLPRGARFQEAVSYVRVLEFARFKLSDQMIEVLATGENEDLKSGDELTIIRYLSEGYYLVWAKDRSRAMDFAEWKKFPTPKTESWVRIKTLSGAEGWAKNALLDWKENCS